MVKGMTAGGKESGREAVEGRQWKKGRRREEEGKEKLHLRKGKKERVQERKIYKSNGERERERERNKEEERGDEGGWKWY